MLNIMVTALRRQLHLLHSWHYPPITLPMFYSGVVEARRCSRCSKCQIKRRGEGWEDTDLDLAECRCDD